MAGDWIKMRSNLWDDPRVARLCDLTDAGEAAIIGGLYWLWASADQHSEDGLMRGLTLRSIDRKTGIKGFGDALVSIGWLADHPEGVRIASKDASDAPLYMSCVISNRLGESAWAALRAVVFARDNYTCTYCGARGIRIECDHIIPVSAGGSNDINNLTTACFTCNRSKGSKLPEVWLEILTARRKA